MSGDARPLVVLLTPNISKIARLQLKYLSNIILHEVPHIGKPSQSTGSWEQSQYTKLSVWSLTHYRKVFYIDADCIVLADLSAIFERDCEFAAAPDVFPPDCFNAGVFLLRPSLQVFRFLLSRIPQTESYDGGDTGFLNEILREQWWRGSESRLEYTWNCQRILHWFTVKRTTGYWDHLVRRGIKILHYSSSPKPWETMGKPGGDLELKWQEMYVSMC